MSLAARLRHRVRIEERVEVQDSETGDVSWTWVPLALALSTSTSSTSSSDGAVSVPAEVLTGPGRETFAAGTKQAEADARMTLRWFPGLTAAHRIVWQSTPYDIVSIETDATGRREYRLRVKAGVNNGG
jgi:head-tail adaptor